MVSIDLFFSGVGIYCGAHFVVVNEDIIDFPDILMFMMMII